MDPIPDETILAVLKLLERHQLGVSSLRVSDDLTPGQALRAIRDPEWFVAWSVGMTKKEYAAWEAHEFQCRATTAAKRRCKNEVEGDGTGGGTYGLPPQDFDPKADRFLFCRVHQPKK